MAYFERLRSKASIRASAVNVEARKRLAAMHCVFCHSFEKGEKLVYGPNLFDIVRKPAGAIEEYDYSAALKLRIDLDRKNMGSFMANPEQFIKGRKARFPGLKSAKKRVDILDYMKTLK